MAVSKEPNVVYSTEEDSRSSLGDEDYSADSELELAGLHSDDDDDEDGTDGSIYSTDHEQERLLNPSLQSTNSSVHTFRTETVYRSPYALAPVVNRDIVDEGLRLYLMFLQEEIIRNSLRTPEFLSRNRIMPRNISSLRALADQFSSSVQRQRIRQQARMVPLHSLNWDSFTDLLFGLFQGGGVTWERILVLFFFCTDISIRALQEQLIQQFQRIQDWTTRFIRETVCAWVELEGGWGAVFQQSLNHATKIAMIGFCCVGIIALCIYIRNNAAK